MANQTRENVIDPSIWTRLLFMLLFGLAYAVAEAIFVVVAIFQFFAALFTGSVNKPLHSFGANLSHYIYQIVQFETFNSEERPFPFSDWPDVPVGDTPWSEDETTVSDPIEPVPEEPVAEATDVETAQEVETDTVESEADSSASGASDDAGESADKKDA